MGEYNESLVQRELARCIGEYFDKASLNYAYSKGYKGRVTNVSNGVDVEIYGQNQKVKTDYQIHAGDSVTLLSLQNQNGDFVVIPTAKQILQTITAG